VNVRNKHITALLADKRDPRRQRDEVIDITKSTFCADLRMSE